MSSRRDALSRAPRFILLLVMILVELMLAPLFAQSESGLHVAQALAVLLMLAALWAAGAERIALLFFFPTLAAHLLFVYTGDETLHAAALLFRVAFFGYMTGRIMWRTLRESDVSFDTIAGAACAYTLLAVVWAGIFSFLEAIHPGSFNIPAAWAIGPRSRLRPGARLFQLRDARRRWATGTSRPCGPAPRDSPSPRPSSGSSISRSRSPASSACTLRGAD